MCGIGGIIDPSLTITERRTRVERMCTALQHRGPDDAGIADIGVGTVGMRRLAIFDPAHGHQPMRTPDLRFTLVFNGAIYNHAELRATLSAGGWEFRTHCDTEVLLAAFAHWGETCLSRLRGMFAFAVWDAREQSLFVARDPFGIKPLYFAHQGNRFVFASEIRGIHASRSIEAALDPAAVADYLAWFAVPAPRTIFRHVASLRPGESGRFQRGRFTLVHAETQPATTAREAACATREEFTRDLRIRLEDTIRAHLLADVPVGAFLSGGLDSAAIVALMNRVSNTRLKTFSIVFEEPGYTEQREADETAQHLGTEHHRRLLTGQDVANDIETLLATLDQPTGDGLNTYYASQAARDGGVKVALSGVGGDELFGGYPSFRDVPRLRRWLPCWRALPAMVRKSLTDRLAKGTTRQRKLADILRHARSTHELNALQRRVFSETTRRSLLAPEARRATAGPFHPELASLGAELENADVLDAVSAWEQRTYMADVLLRDSDVMSMRHSLELRVPFVDRPLLEWLRSQPSRLKFDARQRKSALFDAVRDLVPGPLEHRAKHGFTLPMAIWMKRELRPFLEETFSTASIDRTGLFARPAVQSFWQQFLQHDDPREWSRVWSLAVLIAFAGRRELIVPPPRRIPNITTEPAATGKLTGRTLLLAPEIFASEGGIPRILQLYLRALCELSRGSGKVRLLALNDATLDEEHLASSAGEVETARVCSRNKLRFVKAALELSRGCDRLICGHVAQLPVAWLAKRLNPQLRYYLIAHGIEVWRPLTASERTALRDAEQIFCVSDFTRRELLRHCPLADGRAVVLHNALDPTFAIEPGRPLHECPPVILVITRLTYDDRYKGVEHMIAALPRIRASFPEVQLRIVGRGDDLGRLREIAVRSGVQDAVVFTGYLTDPELQEEIRTCRLFALPSKKEGFGVVFLEAMAQGRPCLGASAGGVPEIITEETGMLVPYGDVDAIAAASIAALRRSWSEVAILAHARRFSYPHFRDGLAERLTALP